MKIVRTDAKKRISLPNSKPGEVYQLIEEEPGRYSLTRMVVPPPRKQPTSIAEVRKAMRSAPLKPKLSWEKLRDLTREP